MIKDHMRTAHLLIEASHVDIDALLPAHIHDVVVNEVVDIVSQCHYGYLTMLEFAQSLSWLRADVNRLLILMAQARTRDSNDKMMLATLNDLIQQEAGAFKIFDTRKVLYPDV